jgi:hypothetical protein
MNRIMGNLEYFIAHGTGPISAYTPDIDALRSGSTRIVVGIGQTSKGQLAYRAASPWPSASGRNR